MIDGKASPFKLSDAVVMATDHKASLPISHGRPQRITHGCLPTIRPRISFLVILSIDMAKFNKLLAIGLSVVAMMSLAAPESKSDVVGDTYSISATVFGGAFGAFAEDGAGLPLTFDGTTKLLGNSIFGDAGDQFIITETQTLAADGITFTVTVAVTAQDAAGNLTTWATPGFTVDDDGDGGITPEVPLTAAVLELATGNGGADTLDVNIGGPFGSGLYPCCIFSIAIHY